MLIDLFWGSVSYDGVQALRTLRLNALVSYAIGLEIKGGFWLLWAQSILVEASCIISDLRVA